MMRLEPIARHRLAAVWPLITQWLGALDERFPPWWRLSDPRGKCENGHAQLWLIVTHDFASGNTEAIKGAVITQITTDAERIAEVPVVVGEDMEDWLHLLNDLEYWARSEGCVAMVSTAAREGWVRVLKTHGWEKQAVLMERRL